MQSGTTQVYCNSVGHIYTCATCFGLYLGHRQLCQYQNRTKEGPLKGSCIDMPVDGLGTGRNM